MEIKTRPSPAGKKLEIPKKQRKGDEHGTFREKNKRKTPLQAKQRAMNGEQEKNQPPKEKGQLFIIIIHAVLWYMTAKAKAKAKGERRSALYLTLVLWYPRPPHRKPCLSQPTNQPPPYLARAYWTFFDFHGNSVGVGASRDPRGAKKRGYVVMRPGKKLSFFFSFEKSPWLVGR